MNLGPEMCQAVRAMARERQREGFERLDQAALLFARVQIEPNAASRVRLRIFLSLIGGEADGGGLSR